MATSTLRSVDAIRLTSLNVSQTGLPGGGGHAQRLRVGGEQESSRLQLAASSASSEGGYSKAARLTDDLRLRLRQWPRGGPDTQGGVFQAGFSADLDARGRWTPARAGRGGDRRGSRRRWRHRQRMQGRTSLQATPNRGRAIACRVRGTRIFGSTTVLSGGVIFLLVTRASIGPPSAGASLRPIPSAEVQPAESSASALPLAVEHHQARAVDETFSTAPCAELPPAAAPASSFRQSRSAGMSGPGHPLPPPAPRSAGSSLPPAPASHRPDGRRACRPRHPAGAALGRLEGRAIGQHAYALPRRHRERH